MRSYESVDTSSDFAAQLPRPASGRCARLGFSIHADSAHIPPTTLDEHVTIGGRSFDVLNGEYRLDPLRNGNTLLHLSSEQRLSTDFNGYAGLWSDAVMSSLQSSILQVVQHRCEHQQAAALTSH